MKYEYIITMFNTPEITIDYCTTLEKARALVEVYVWENMYSNIEGDNEFLRVDYEIFKLNKETGEKELVETTKGRRLIPDWR